jgi:predicted transcriptional regulator
MSTFQQQLNDWLDVPGNTQSALAEAIGKTQAAVSRYAAGRLPDADTARDIEKHTGGAVTFDAWQREFLSRSGLAA